MRKKQKTQGNARTLVNSSPHRTTGGAFVEGLTVGHVEYESRNEANAIKTLLLCSDVKKITSQPISESYLLNGVPRLYTPDFIVDAHVDGLRLEIKSIAYIAHTDSQWEKYLAIAKSYREREIPFAFLVDAQLEEQPRFGNIKLFARYVTSQVAAGVSERAVLALTAGPLRVERLLKSAELALVDVLTLIATRQLSFDWMQEFNREATSVSLLGQPYEGLKLENILRSSRYGNFLEELAMGGRSSDKRILADAKNWRRRYDTSEPWSMVGGFVSQSSMRHLREEESLPRDFERRKRFAPGRVDLEKILNQSRSES